MSLDYGFIKAKIKTVNGVQSSHHPHEIQYHIHITLDAPGTPWDVAINVGTNDADDLVKYKLVYDFHHPITATLGAAALGYTDLTGTEALPALDFIRGDILAQTGAWRLSDVMDGSDTAEPIASLLRLLDKAKTAGRDVYVFGRSYTGGDSGIHDTHMNQGSSGTHFLHTAGDDSNDHNDIWQDGALMVDLGGNLWAAYFAAFQQQLVPTDGLGNPGPDSHEIA